MAAMRTAVIFLHAAKDVRCGLLLPTVVVDSSDGIRAAQPVLGVLADDPSDAPAPTETEHDVLVPSLCGCQVLCRLPTTSAMGALTPQLPKIGRLVTLLGDKFVV